MRPPNTGIRIKPKARSKTTGMEPAWYDLIMKQVKAIINMSAVRKKGYRFIDVETLVADFLAEIEKARRK